VRSNLLVIEDFTLLIIPTF